MLARCAKPRGFALLWSAARYRLCFFGSAVLHAMKNKGMFHVKHCQKRSGRFLEQKNGEIPCKRAEKTRRMP